jgi:hypothetical protein
MSRLFGSGATMTLLAGCDSDGHMHAKLSGNKTEFIHVLYDSPAVEQLFSEALRLQARHQSKLASRDQNEKMAAFLDFKYGNIPAELAVGPKSDARL